MKGKERRKDEMKRGPARVQTTNESEVVLCLLSCRLSVVHCAEVKKLARGEKLRIGLAEKKKLSIK